MWFDWNPSQTQNYLITMRFQLPVRMLGCRQKIINILKSRDDTIVNSKKYILIFKKLYTLKKYEQEEKLFNTRFS